MTLKLIDSHVHFWDTNTFRLSWLDELPTLQRPFLPDDLREEVGDITLEKLVFIQAEVAPDEALREVEWVTSLAQSAPEIAAIAAFAPLERGDAVAGYLEQLQEHTLVTGVRRLIKSEALGFATQPSFIAGVQQLAAFDLSFDICIDHTYLADVLQLVAQCPDVRFVLDHIGGPDFTGRTMQPWQDHITELAQHDNVWCKLSGIPTDSDDARWIDDHIKPFIAHVIDVFGVERVMFGSDWPVMRLASSYPRWVTVLQSLTSHFNEAERHQLFYQNAAAFYKLP